MFSNYIKYSLLLLIVFFSCDDIERDNILDPKNPASERPQIITVEAFVNTTDSIPNDYNQYLLNALNELENIYSGKITIAEYHRLINNRYPDGYDLDKNDILYGYYFNYFWNLNNNTIKGVPDVFINGTEARVQGASSTASVLLRLQQAIDPIISQNGYFTVEPNITQEGNEYKISAKIARLGSTNAEDIILKAVIVSKFDNGLHERVVTEYLKSQEISNISNGEIKDVELGDIAETQVDTKVIFMVTSEDELQVFQSLEVDLN